MAYAPLIFKVTYRAIELNFKILEIEVQMYSPTKGEIIHIHASKTGFKMAKKCTPNIYMDRTKRKEAML